MSNVHIASLTDLQGVQSMVRQNALCSFAFFANNVLAAQLADDVCTAAQDVVEDAEDAVVRTGRPRELLLALHGWLNARGAHVLAPLSLPRYEILQWLCLDEDASHDPHSVAIILELIPQGVKVTWV